jgi:hypothetical protein
MAPEKKLEPDVPRVILCIGADGTLKDKKLLEENSIPTLSADVIL